MSLPWHLKPIKRMNFRAGVRALSLWIEGLAENVWPTVIAGNGAPTTSEPKGSFYLRHDGSGAAAVAYVATDAVGTWVALTGTALSAQVQSAGGQTYWADLGAAATGESDIILAANLADAQTIRTAALTFEKDVTTTATPGKVWTYSGTGAYSALSEVAQINHATNAFNAAEFHATQLTAARTAGLVGAVKAGCTSLAGDNTTTPYCDFLAATPTDGGGTATHSAFYVASGHDRAMDLTNCATGEALFALCDNLAIAAEWKEGANSYLKFITTNAGEAVAVNQPLKVANKIYSIPATVQDVAGAGGTITLPAAGFVQRVSATGGAGTGTILTAGTDGQIVQILNIAGNSITFAASGTSHVALGATCVIPALSVKQFIYDGVSSLWYSHGPT